MRSYKRIAKTESQGATVGTSSPAKPRAASVPPYVFQVLDALDSEVVTNQRQLAASAGISLGQANTTLHRLMEKRMVSIGNLRPESGRLQRVYRLTTKGKQAKGRLAVNFISAHLEEAKRLKTRLINRLAPLEKDSPRVVVLGPEEIGKFVKCTIKLEDLDMVMVGHCTSAEDLARIDAKDFDRVLFFDAAQAGLEATARKAGLPPERFVPLL